MTRSTTIRDVPLDANVIVGFLDPGDSLHAGAVSLLARLQRQGREVVLLQFLVEEAVSALCRRARQRNTLPPPLRKVEATILAWQNQGLIESMSDHLTPATAVIFDIVFRSGGVLNVNDAKLVHLQTLGAIGQVATFDQRLIAVPGFKTIAAEIKS